MKTIERILDTLKSLVAYHERKRVENIQMRGTTRDPWERPLHRVSMRLL